MSRMSLRPAGSSSPLGLRSPLVFLHSTAHHVGWVSRNRIGNLHLRVQRPNREERFPMSWICPRCGAAVDAPADRCWGCKGPRSEPEPGFEMVSTPVSGAHQEVAPAVGDTESARETPQASGAPEPLPPPPEVSATRSWTCSKCRETVDAGFLVCWSCGTSVEGVEDPSFVGACETDLGDNETQAITFLDDALEEPKPGPAPRP